MRNFMVYARQTVYLENQGVIRIEGRNLDDPSAESNMVGKSTIIEAICWVLFEKTIRGLRDDSIISSFAGKNCLVSFSFNSDKSNFRVTRYRKHFHYHNGLRLFQNGQELTYRHKAETQKKLEEVCQFLDYITFLNSVIFGGAKSFASMSDAEQKKILESFLHFELVDSALVRTKQRLASASETLQSLELKIEEQRGTVREFKAKIKSADEFEARVEEERAQIKTELANLGRAKSWASKIKQAEKITESLQRKYIAAKEKSTLLGNGLSKMKELLKNKKALIGNPCPICGAIVRRRTLGAYLRHLKAEFKEHRRKLKITNRRVSQYNGRYIWSLAELKRLETKQNTQRDSIARRITLEERLAGLLGITDRSSDDYEYSKSVSQLLIMLRQKAKLEREQKDLEFWTIGFGNTGIKSIIIKKALPWLNNKLSEYASQIFGEPTNLRFSASKGLKSGEERELFHVEYGNNTGYIGESSGGRKRIDICVLLTFASLSRVSNLLLVDELLDGLDSIGREIVLEILASLRGTVICISHSKDVKSHIGKVWTVVKKNGVSKLEYEKNLFNAR
jgi:DNA repair exonuclease SbcCD ATPase subunit